MEFDYPLPDGWKWVPLGELADKKGRAIVSGPFGSNISSKFFVEDGIPVIRGNNLTTGSQKFVDGGFVFVTPEKAKELGNVDAVRDDIIFTAAGSLGQVGIIPERTRFPLYIISNKQMRVRLNRELIDPLFAFQWLSSAGMVAHIQRQNTGSSVPLINLSIVRRLQVPLPPLPEQKAIAAVLGALDDKIELNRRMNATLEAMARALFQRWFVDFDPVRAKLDGRQPADLDATTAALFPAHFQESPLGHIPQGWTVEPVGEVVECVGGGTPSTAEPKFWEGGTHHWTTPKDFSSLQAPILLDTDRKITDAGVAKISSGLLPAGTLLLSSRAPVGYLAIAAMPVAINQGFIAIKCNERASHYFMLNWCQTNMAEIESRATGTTFAEISKQNFRPILVVLPPKELMAAFTKKVAPLYAQITANLQQSRTLATLRDALLPKLLSGELPAISQSTSA